MEYFDADPLPQVCQACTDRKECLVRGEPEWCCDECDYALLRWPIPKEQELEGLKAMKQKAIDRLRRQIEEIDKELDSLRRNPE